MEQNQNARYFNIRLEDMCGKNSKDFAAKLLNEVLGDAGVGNPDKTVNTEECRLGKHKVCFWQRHVISNKRISRAKIPRWLRS